MFIFMQVRICEIQIDSFYRITTYINVKFRLKKASSQPLYALTRKAKGAQRRIRPLSPLIEVQTSGNGAGAADSIHLHSPSHLLVKLNVDVSSNGKG